MTTETIQINIREDGSRVVVVNLNNIINTADRTTNSIFNLNRSLDFLRRGFLVLGIVSVTRQLVEMMDAVIALDARLKLITKGTDDYATAQEDLYRISQANNVSLKETAALYVKLYDPVKRLGGSAKEVAAIAESLTASLKIGGATVKESTSAILQFGQAMGAGRLSGDEFRTMAEAAPKFMSILADYLKVPTGALKAMASQGKLTSDVIGNALINNLNKLRNEAADVANTISGSFSDLTNDTFIMIGAFDKLTGTSSNLMDIITAISLVVIQLGQVFKDELVDGSAQVSSGLDTMSITILIVGRTVETLLVMYSELAFVFKRIGSNIGAESASLIQFLQGNLKEAAAIREMSKQDDANARAELDRYQVRILGMTDKALAARDALKNAKLDDITGLGSLNKPDDPAANEKALLEVRMRLDGITKDYFNDLNTLQKALSSNNITTEEYIRLVSELATKTFEASKAGKDLVKSRRGNDDRLKVLQDMLLQEKTAFDREKNIFEQRSKMLDIYHNKFATSEEEYYAGRELARVEFLNSENASYIREKTMIESFRPKNAKEATDNKIRLDKLLKDHLEFYNKLANARSEDVIDQLATAKTTASQSDDMLNNYLTSLQKEVTDLQKSNEARETSRSSLERQNVAILDSAIAYQEQFMVQQLINGATEKELEQAPNILKYLQDQRKLRADLASGFEKQESDKFSKESAERAIKNWRKVGTSIADSLKDAFGQGGKAIGQMFQAYSEGVAGQLEAQKKLGEAKKLSDENPEKIKAIREAHIEGSTAQIKSYASMANAAKGFFEESSKGYRAMDAAVKVLHASEVALSLIKGVNAVLTQGEGDPYSAFARMSAMAALVVGLGVALSGSMNSGISAKERQEKQGSGSILGDDKAKSDSIARSLDYIEQNSDLSLSHTANSEMYLKNISDNISNLASLIARTTGLSGNSKSTGVKEGTFINKSGLVGATLGSVFEVLSNIPVIGKIITSLFGTTTSVIDQGIELASSTLRSVEEFGIKAFSYADVKKTSKFLGFTTGSSVSTQSHSLSDEINSQFSLIIKGLGDSVVESADLLGVGGDEFVQRLQSFVIDIGKISFKDMTGTEIEEALQAVFSKVGDDLAKFGLPGLERFQKVGEGYFETLTRLATNYANLDSILSSIGQTFGQTGIESLDARERLIGLSGGISELSSKTKSFADDFLSKAERLAPVQKYVTDQLKAMGLAGIDTRDKFKETVLALASSGALATESGAKLYAQLIDLSDEFAQVYAVTKDLTKSQQEISDERESLQDELDKLVLTSTELYKKQREAINDSNKALFDQIVLINLQKEEVDRLKEASQGAFKTLSNAINREKDTAKATFDTNVAILKAQKSSSEAMFKRQIDDSKKSLESTKTDKTEISNLSGNLKSTLASIANAANQGVNRIVAQNTISKALDVAINTGVLPKAEDIASALSVASKQNMEDFGSYQDFASNFYETAGRIAELNDITGLQLTDSQKAIELAQEQIDLLTLNSEAESVRYDSLIALEQEKYDTQIAKLDSQLEFAQMQLDAMNGTVTEIKSLNVAFVEFALAIKATLAAQIQQKANIVSAIPGNDPINMLYEKILGREGDTGGLAFWNDLYSKGAALDKIAVAFYNSPEYQNINGSHKNGLNSVPFNGYRAELHAGEMVLPEAVAQTVRDNVGGIGTDDVLKVLGNISDRLERIEKSSEKTAENTKETAASLDSAGGGNGPFEVIVVG